MTTLKPPFRAADMNGLYKRVLKGAYPAIPRKYTKDLADVIMKMLSVESKARPTCEGLLKLDIVKKRYMKLFPEDFADEEDAFADEDYSTDELLNTIRVP